MSSANLKRATRLKNILFHNLCCVIIIVLLLLLLLLNKGNLNGKQLNCLVSQLIENKPLRGHEVSVWKHRRAKPMKVYPASSPHLFAVCIFVVFPWLSYTTDTIAMKRPGNANYKIGNIRSVLLRPFYSVLLFFLFLSLFLTLSSCKLKNMHGINNKSKGVGVVRMYVTTFVTNKLQINPVHLLQFLPNLHN